MRKGAERIGKVRIVMTDCGWMDDGCGARRKAGLTFLLWFGRDWSGLVRFGRGDRPDDGWWMMDEFWDEDWAHFLP